MNELALFAGSGGGILGGHLLGLTQRKPPTHPPPAGHDQAHQRAEVRSPFIPKLSTYQSGSPRWWIAH